jgi:H+/Cl- antiporter ClcA
VSEAFNEDRWILPGLLVFSLLTTAVAFAFFLALKVVALPISAQPPWLLPLIVAAGGLVSGVVTQLSGAKGLLLNGALEVRKQGSRLTASVPFLVIWATAVLVGTDGSAGIEGPSAVIGMGTGSNFTELFGVRLREQRHWFESWGMAALVGAMFNSPLAGAFFACEITSKEEGSGATFQELFWQAPFQPSC